MKNNQNGFSLIELLVVVVIIGILASLAIIGYHAAVKGTRDSVQTTRLMQYVDAQNKFKTVKGKRRFGTLDELYQEGLLNESVVKYSHGTQVMLNDWMLVPGDESTGFLREHFFVTLTRDDPNSTMDSTIPKSSKTTYCIAEDGVLRSSSGGKGKGACTISSNPVEK